MKLLLDENLSPRLVELLAAEFPDSTHIERLKLRGAADAALWAYGADHEGRTATYHSVVSGMTPACPMESGSPGEPGSE